MNNYFLKKNPGHTNYNTNPTSNRIIIREIALNDLDKKELLFKIRLDYDGLGNKPIAHYISNFNTNLLKIYHKQRII